MTQALQLKFYVQGLSPEDAEPVIEHAVSGEDWRDGFVFYDGSSVSVRFVEEDSLGTPRCIVQCYDAVGNQPKPVVRAKFTCKYLSEGTYVEAYYDGSTLLGNPVPYLTYSDVMGMKDLLDEVQVIDVRLPHYWGVGNMDAFEILPPGYEWGEHSTVEFSLLDLGKCVIQVYAIGGLDWNWCAFLADDENAPCREHRMPRFSTPLVKCTDSFGMPSVGVFVNGSVVCDPIFAHEFFGITSADHAELERLNTLISQATSAAIATGARLIQRGLGLDIDGDVGAAERGHVAALLRDYLVEESLNHEKKRFRRG